MYIETHKMLIVKKINYNEIKSPIEYPLYMNILKQRFPLNKCVLSKLVITLTEYSYRCIYIKKFN